MPPAVLSNPFARLGPMQFALIAELADADPEWVPRDQLKYPWYVIEGLTRRGLLQQHCATDDEGEITRRFYRYRAPDTPAGDFNEWCARQILKIHPELHKDLDPRVKGLLERHKDLLPDNPWLLAAYYSYEPTA